MNSGPVDPVDAEVQAEKNKVPLDLHERRDVKARSAASARVVHEVVRQQGIDELERPAASLVWSGIAGGLAIGLSVLGVAVLETALPPSPWRPALAGLGYSLGFVVVILARLQLFTESTVTAVIPLATQPTLKNLGRTARLWTIVLLANFAGTFAFALFIHAGGLGSAELTGATFEVATAVLGRSPAAVFSSAIPAGFLIAVLVWALPSAQGQQLWLIVILTGIIQLGHFSHIVAGSAEVWLNLLSGKQAFVEGVLHFLLPALAGNIVGGSALFALLAHAQVRHEITE